MYQAKQSGKGRRKFTRISNPRADGLEMENQLRRALTARFFLCFNRSCAMESVDIRVRGLGFVCNIRTSPGATERVISIAEDSV